VSAAHLDYDTLADLAEGLLDESLAASADAHLVSCAVCRDRSAEIADVSRLLADAPVPPMPAELAARIDQALAAEAAAGPAPASVADLENRRRHKRLRVMSMAAAAVVVVGGGAFVARTLVGGSVSSDSQTAASKPVQDRTARPNGQSGQGGAASKLQGPAEAAFPAARSGTDYTAAKLGDQVSAQLTKNRAARAPSATREFAAPQQLSGCVGRVAQGKSPMLVDVARYEGRPATLIVVPAATADRLDVWVVGPACSATETALVTHTQTPAQ
jgi:hypothetical protein